MQCYFCRSQATLKEIDATWSFFEISCSEICGKYRITTTTAAQVGTYKQTSQALLNCIAENIKLNSSKLIPIWAQQGMNVPVTDQSSIRRDLENFIDQPCYKARLNL